MSINRIVRRRAYKSEKTAKPWHEYAIEAGYRHPTFQQRIRAARKEHGLQPTSSDMSRVHGRRV